MGNGTNELLVAAVGVAFFHTLIGPDHYLPFIVMSVSRKWSITKTTLITFLCGIGHVGSSVALGFVGIALGMAVHKLEALEGIRGDLAAWMFVAFGFTYFVWGVHRAYKNKPHRHLHQHEEGLLHEHLHNHESGHAHVHDMAETKFNITPWALFVIFVLGPCEPLIPLVMYPAAKSDFMGVVLVTVSFSIITIATMLAIVLISTFGVSFLPLSRMQRYSHALAGGTIFLCGIAILFGL